MYESITSISDNKLYEDKFQLILNQKENLIKKILNEKFQQTEELKSMVKLKDRHR